MILRDRLVSNRDSFFLSFFYSNLSWSGYVGRQTLSTNVCEESQVAPTHIPISK